MLHCSILQLERASGSAASGIQVHGQIDSQLTEPAVGRVLWTIKYKMLFCVWQWTCSKLRCLRSSKLVTLNIGTIGFQGISQKISPLNEVSQYLSSLHLAYYIKHGHREKIEKKCSKNHQLSHKNIHLKILNMLTADWWKKGFAPIYSILDPSKQGSVSPYITQITSCVSYFFSRLIHADLGQQHHLCLTKHGKHSPDPAKRTTIVWKKGGKIVLLPNVHRTLVTGRSMCKPSLETN